LSGAFVKRAKEEAMSKIFVRERRKVEQGEKKARFRVVGISGTDLKLKVDHIRRIELNAIAEATGAEVVYLPAEGEGKFGNKPK
jgi:hypothetical protein